MSQSNPLYYEPKTLLLDIEAAPAKAYIWDLRTRYVPIDQVAEDGFVLCWSAKWLGEENPTWFSSRWDYGEQAMVEEAWHLLDEADEVVTYNGNNYDLPRLNTEFLKYRLGPPAPYHSTDLYPVVKTNFRMLSRSLNHLLQTLEMTEKMKHKGMALWTGCMNGVKEDQDLMEEYNVADVHRLEEVYPRLYPWITRPMNKALWMPPTGKPTCHCGSTNVKIKGYKRTNAYSYVQYYCNDCGRYPRRANAVETGHDRRRDTLR